MSGPRLVFFIVLLSGVCLSLQDQRLLARTRLELDRINSPLVREVDRFARDEQRLYQPHHQQLLSLSRSIHLKHSTINVRASQVEQSHFRKTEVLSISQHD